jgi:divalent metal cation (Fe/Co/Zn/Cd) transporter
MDADQRHGLTGSAIRWSVASLVWATLAGAIALVAGVAASSLALVGFGANCLLDGTASGILVWRFRHERAGAHADAVEQTAARAVGAVMIIVGLYLGVRSIDALAEHSAAEASALGTIVASMGVLVLPVLARGKLRLAAPLRSPGLRGDGILSLAGGLLAAATLLSLLLDGLLDWWWADAAVALVIAAVLVLEGSRTIATAHSLGP